MRMLKHPGIMTFYELYEGENYIYCLIELFQGGNLLDKIKKFGRFTELQALLVTRQLLEALMYLESIDVIHRDIKPENILFKGETFTGGVAIVDLGFATKKTEYNQLFARCGTPGYVAPEIYKDDSYDVNVDIFSLGVILYLMLTASVPFRGKYQEVVTQNIRCEIDFALDKKGVKVSPESTVRLT